MDANSIRKHYMSNLWRWSAGLPELPEPKRIIPLKEMWEAMWSNDFINFMHRRMTMGGYRYGKLNEPGKPAYDMIGEAIKRLNLYKIDGNVEHLFDAANFCLAEFVEGKHPLKHLAVSDDKIHMETK
jgi:hypothetical protein